MKQLIFLIVLAPMFAADPQGVVVLKSGDLKSFDKSLPAKLDSRKAAMKEFSKAGDYETTMVHREGDGDVETENNAVLLIIESGQATLVEGKKPGTAVAEGDVVFIPAHLPHQTLVAPGNAVTYLVIRQEREESQPENATSSAQPALAKKPVLGADLGSGFRACVAGENSPDGTVVDGYRKMISQSFLGSSCIWKPEGSPETVTTSSKVPDTARPGANLGQGYRGCVAGDNSPAGTIVDGYRKVMTTSPFGVSCGWEKVQ